MKLNNVVDITLKLILNVIKGTYKYLNKDDKARKKVKKQKKLVLKV